LLQNADWFRSTVLPTKYWEFVEDQDAPSYRGRIIKWFYDDELVLFIIKRYDACEYLKPTMEAFNSLPETDFADLAHETVVNPSRNDNAELCQKWIRNDRFLQTKREIDQSKYMFHPRKVKRIVKDDGTAMYKSGRIKCL